jgi:O-acetyl-ADP-ribose deacetylase (regulator of RNase III)
MSVIIKSGDLFTAGTEALICTVNCVGVMGRGIALEFKERYPDMFAEYVKLCKRGHIQVGFMWFWLNPHFHSYLDGPRYVINFPTKENWRNPSKIEWISAGLADLRNRVTMLGIESIAIPALGCSNGKLSWTDVRPLIMEKLNDLEISIILYEPQ